MTFFHKVLACAAAFIPFDASAESVQIGTLACDVSKGIGMFVVEKQKLSCSFKQKAAIPTTTPDRSTNTASQSAKSRRAT